MGLETDKGKENGTMKKNETQNNERKKRAKG